MDLFSQHYLSRYACIDVKDKNISDKDRAMAEKCLECPVCRHARKTRRGSLSGSAELSKVISIPGARLTKGSMAARRMLL
jgi:hypothetical protein